MAAQTECKDSLESGIVLGSNESKSFVLGYFHYHALPQTWMSQR